VVSHGRVSLHRDRRGIVREHGSGLGVPQRWRSVSPQFSTLAKLREVGPCSQNHLGRLIHYDSATITGVINRLKLRDLLPDSQGQNVRCRHHLQDTHQHDLQGRVEIQPDVVPRRLLPPAAR
jgi:hypothetical protein